MPRLIARLVPQSVPKSIAQLGMARACRGGVGAGVTMLMLLTACTNVGSSAGAPVERRGGAAPASPVVVPAPAAPAIAVPAPAVVPAPAAPPSTAPSPPPNAPVGVATRGAAMLATMSVASQALVAQSRQQVVAGNLSAAADDLERALRIDPGQPLLWLELGEVRLAAGDRGQAENMALKAQSLAGKDPAIRARAEDLLVRARH